MYFKYYIFMCLYIGTYLYFSLTNTPLPEYFRTVNVWVSWAFILWAGFMSGRIIVDCIMLLARNQMTTDNFIKSVSLGALYLLPVFLMSIFMLREGFK